MTRYESIKNVYRRDESTNKLIMGDYSMPEFGYLANCDWIFTEKVDGTNIRLIWKGKQFSIRGRSDNANIPPRLLARLRELTTEIASKMEAEFGERTVCLYGEGYGVGIQKVGKDYLPDSNDFRLFDVWLGSEEQGYWSDYEDVFKTGIRLGIPVVPIRAVGALEGGIHLVQRGLYSTVAENGNTFAEGLVARPEHELTDKFGNRIITKIKHRDFYKGE